MPDIPRLLSGAPRPDVLARQAVVQRARRNLRPPGGLARLDLVAPWLAAWQRNDCPSVTRPAMVLAASNHGARWGVSSWPSHPTAAVVDAVRAGAATSSVLAESAGVALRVVDAGVGDSGGDIAAEPAMAVDRLEELFDLGRRQVAELDTDLLLLGEIGIGNTTVAAAVCLGLFGGEPDDWVGRGAGADEEARHRKLEAVGRAMEWARPPEPFEVLRQVGVPEMAVLAGACLEARLRSLPVLLDGFAVTAAVAPLALAWPGALEHCLASHLSAEPGHGRLLDRLGLEPLLELDLAVGEGTGALLAVPIVRMATRAVVDVVTFEEWGL